MTLLLHRRAIEAAVAGRLDARAERRLRAHLSTCEACRAHYDATVLAARTLTGRETGTALELERERARLLERLDGLATPAPGPRRAGWLLLPAAMAALLAVLAALPSPERQVTERGSGDEAPPPFSVSLYARAKSGATPVRLAAQLPESGEATVSAGDWVQAKAPPGVAVVVVLAGQPPRALSPGASEALPPGVARLFAARAPPEVVLRAAEGLTPSAPRLPLDVPQVTGVLSVQP
ncbi:MAG: zf-HC2 domain-containing protein [Myxococcaceae bacterium]|nr:zf-HC2 domain-containing protein [Myxococcaceae bacterium]MCA3011806.1 zf-HC2 domain-containing protein [Myxococcaceae bacterium]